MSTSDIGHQGTCTTLRSMSVRSMGDGVSAYGHYVPLMALGKGVLKHVRNDCALGNLAEDGDVVRQLLGESARLHAIGCDERRAATGAARRRGAGRGTAVSAYSRTWASSATVNGTPASVRRCQLSDR